MVRAKSDANYKSFKCISFVFLTPLTDPDPKCKDGQNLLSFKQSVQTAVGFNSKFLSSPVNFFSTFCEVCFLQEWVFFKKNS